MRKVSKGTTRIAKRVKKTVVVLATSKGRWMNGAYYSFKKSKKHNNYYTVYRNGKMVAGLDAMLLWQLYKFEVSDDQAIQDICAGTNIDPEDAKQFRDCA